MSKTDGGKSFPLAETDTVYAPFLYLYYILCRRDHYSFHVISVHYYMLCAYRLPYLDPSLSPRKVPFAL